MIDKIKKIINTLARKLIEKTDIAPSYDFVKAVDVYNDVIEENKLKNLEKRKKFEESLKNQMTSLHFDPRCNGVDVPQKFRHMEELILNYSYNFGISDFSIDDDEVVATLSFSGIKHKCVVPWDSVINVLCETREVKAPPETQNVKREKPKLTLIKGGKQ